MRFLPASITVEPMDTQHGVGWLHRRAGFGLHPTELADATLRGPDEELERLLAAPAATADPWDGLALDPDDGGRPEAVRGWLASFLATTQPFHDRRTWMLHGWLVSSMDKVNIPRLMVDQIRLFMNTGGGSFPELLQALTTDPAMLVYLDGRTSTGASPNENYGRELLELFALGVGNYTEADVQAAARALTGWVANPRGDQAVFVNRRHDNSPQTLLGATGVNDVDSVIDAVIASPAHAPYVAQRIAKEYLGDIRDPERTDVIDELTATYLATDMQLDPVIARALSIGLDGTSAPMVLAPLPWVVMCARATGVSFQRLFRTVQGTVREMGQVPMFPPSVAGWPTGTAWLTSSSLVARTNVAAGIADSTAADQPIRIAAENGDLDLIAEQLGLPEPFTQATIAAIQSASTPVGRLALALVCPENLLS